ncbi:MAG: sigma-54-dependent Fis family transcriptional regulator [Ignavibacteriales bacterium]|nr:sigma-54-dependent Fis family transcriptional regulator [Ignavibacteriales bacterium]
MAEVDSETICLIQSHYSLDWCYQEADLQTPVQSEQTIMAPSSQLATETLQSPTMQGLLKSIPRIAASDLGILLVGEFGTGKEWLARKIHQMGSRAGKIFLSMDCTMLTPDTVEQDIFGQELFGEKGVRIEDGILEEANAGTVFFDGFTSLPTEIQMKVSRALAHQKYHRVGGKRELWFNARVIVAINKLPSEHTIEGALQKESLNRIAPIVIEVPPLRQRQDDLLPLINLFIGQVNERYKTSVRGIKAEALHRCLAYSWPFN